jgi:hypothetical protein
VRNICLYWLYITYLPGETKETIKENRLWITGREVKNRIHFNNGLPESPGQYYYPYDNDCKNGIMLDGPKARTAPTYIPNSFLEESFFIKDLERVNFYSQLIMDYKLYPLFREYTVREFVTGKDQRHAAWLAIGIRCGGIL